MKIGIITDIHENVGILEETLKKAEENRCDEVACLGDIVGFDTRFYDFSMKRSAKSCIELIESNCRWVVAGNHDLNSVSRFPSWTNGFEYPEGWFIMSSNERKRISSGKVWCYEYDSPNDLSEKESGYLSRLPEYIIPEVSQDSILFSHYIFPDFTGSTTLYVERSNQMKKHWDFMSSNKVSLSFIGHSHNIFAGFAYKKNGLSVKAFHSLPNNYFVLGEESVVVLLPPLSGDKGKTGFTIFDTSTRRLSLIPTGFSKT